MRAHADRNSPILQEKKPKNRPVDRDMGLVRELHAPNDALLLPYNNWLVQKSAVIKFWFICSIDRHTRNKQICFFMGELYQLQPSSLIKQGSIKHTQPQQVL